jgi:hypothetical protein
VSEINKVFAGLNTRLRKFKQEFGMEFVERVKQRTPVVSGALQGGWGFQTKQSDIEIYNTKDYASFVEHGTDKMAPRGMLRTTMLEAEDIAKVAAERSKK